MNSRQLPHWDLSNVYPSLDSEEFHAAMHEMQARLEDLSAYVANHRIAKGEPVSADTARVAQIVGDYLDQLNAILRLGSTLGTYLHSYVATDSYNHEARRLMSQFEPLVVQLDRLEVRFQGWIAAVAEQPEGLGPVLALDGPARRHAFYLQEMVEQSRYLMSAEEEGLASELSLSGIRAWSKLQGVITSQLKVTFERDGSVREMPMAALQNLRHDPDEDVRRRAFEAELAAWERLQEPLAACMNGVKGTQATLNRLRGRTDALHEPIDQARIDRQTLDAMLGAMRDSFPMFRRYFQGKAGHLGKNALPWWDLSAPVGQAETHYAFDEARDFILEQFATFSDGLVDFTRRAFERNWIDAEPRDGKRGGAFCMGVPAVEESRILCNFDGSLDQVSTLAHELGHAYHNKCMAGKEMLLRRTPMTLAETASIFNETIVTDALLVQATE
jgi:pepF/M3 family oligoendopeptidase